MQVSDYNSYQHFSTVIKKCNLFQVLIGMSSKVNVLLLTVVILLALYKWYTRNVNYWRNRNIPGPIPKFFIGNLWDCLTLKHSLGTLLSHIYTLYDTPLVGIFTMDEPALIVRDPEIIKNVLQKDFNYFSDRTIYPSEHNDVFKNLLFIQKNPEWKSARGKLTPVFSSVKVKGLFDIVNNVAKEMVTYVKNNPEQETKDLFQKYSCEMSTQSFFGITAQCFKHKNSEFDKHVKALYGFTIRNALVQTSYCFNINLIRIFKLNFYKDEIEVFFRDVFWQSMNNIREMKVKPKNFISLLDDLRKSDPTFGK